MDVSEPQIIAYLLGQLDEPARSRLEAHLLEDEQLFRFVSEIEDDLIIRYVRGDLEGEQVASFEEAYLKPPSKRARVESARALREAALEVASQRAEPRAFPPAQSRLRFSLVFAAVAGVVIMAVLPLWKSRKPTQDPGSFATQPSGSSALVSFVLEPGLFRSGSGKQFALPAGIRQVEFELVLQDPSAASAYGAVLSTPERPGMWSGAAAQRGAHFYVVVAESILKDGDYTLELVPTDSKDKPQSPTAYYFRIVR